MKCQDCQEYNQCRKNANLRSKRRRCPKAKEKTVYTNADRIRAMSDEELAKFLEYEGGGACAEVCGWLEWLRQPAEED